MGLSLSKVWNGVDAWGGWNSPFTAPVPVRIRETLLRLQSERLHESLPLLCLTISACAIAMALAVLGDLPWWQQLAPPLIIVGFCLGLLAHSRMRGRPTYLTDILKGLQAATYCAAGLGLVAGIWCVNAFVETEKYYCMVAPVFIGIVALIGATCLLSVPRAAIAGILGTLTPIVIKLATYDNFGLRAMATMLVVVGIMQSAVVVSKFRETVGMLTLQDDLNTLAGTDALTGLDNRLSFMRKLEDELARNQPLFVVLGDLDGFKQVNDENGHAAGDAVLVGVAERLKALAITARSVARLGGDEFALLYEGGMSEEQANIEVMAMAGMVPLPIAYGEAQLSVGMSLGKSRSPEDGRASSALLAAADMRLYIDKARRKGGERQAKAA